MTVQEYTAVDTLAQIGVAISQKPAGWGWSIESDKIILGWQGAYATPARAALAAQEWLLEYARKGLLCQVTHTAQAGEDLMTPWLRAFSSGIEVAE